jgi:hypothetical protein
MNENAGPKGNALLEGLRKVTVGIVVQSLSALDRAKRIVDQETYGDANASTLRTVPAPSLSKLHEFMGSVAHLGLEQVNGLLTLHARYSDDFIKWWIDYFWPKRVADMPAPELVEIRSEPGGKAEKTVVVTNRRHRSGKVTAGAPVLRSADGKLIHAWSAEVTPASFELEAQQAWPFAIKMCFANGASPLPAGPYVGAVDFRIEDCIVHRVLLDIRLTDGK